jgi:hypothetical protein
VVSRATFSSPCSALARRPIGRSKIKPPQGGFMLRV